MGKFLRYEDSNFRTFKIDTTAETIERPKRVVTNADLLGAVVVIDGEECIVVSSVEVTATITATLVADGEIAQLVYTKATDSFALGEDSLDNVLVDEFGRQWENIE